MYNNKYYIENRDKILVYKKKHYLENKVEILKKVKEYQKIKGINPHPKKKRRKKKKIIKKIKQKKSPEEIKEQKRLYREKDKQYRKNNAHKIKERKRLYRENNHEKLREKDKQYRKNNAEKIKERKRLWRKNNPEKVREMKRRYQKNNAEKYNINNNISRAIRYSLDNNNKAGRHWENLVGYSLEDLIKRLNKTMPKGYTWQDYLEGKLHIDHIIPKSVFNFTKPEHTDFKKCWALSNLQLLPAKENLIKGSKLSKPFQPALKLSLISL